MTSRTLVAIDLGASSGRVMLGRYHADGRLTLQEIRRFNNRLLLRDGLQTWDLESLEAEIRAALQQLDTQDIVPDSIGIDSWGVDFVLLDQQGEPVGYPVSYRDARCNGIMARAQQELGAEFIYQRTGIQFLPFNTLYQLRALSEQQPEQVRRGARFLMLPDYLHY
ncbi:MAG: FGGY family carbohydrate kinase, partial [Enterobacteriaceae bacterium]